MGATVLLFNKYERLIAKTVTKPGMDGSRLPASLLDLYSAVRVSLASFLPASRDRIARRESRHQQLASNHFGDR